MNNIHKSWLPLFDQYDIDIEKIYFKNEVYPPKNLIFRVFEMDVNDISILLLGQDPYHGINQANGFCFSVSNEIKIPPSLNNIYKELKLEFPERNYIFTSGNLENWFYREKIFLLNSSLTVIKGKPNSHIQYWGEFTDDVIKFINDNNKKCIFLLLGNFAKKKAIFISDKSKIIYGIHPSPLARGFIGSNIFKKVEEKLNREIDWSI